MNAFCQRKFLILTAHPDDAESACGGLISKIIAGGGAVTNLIMVRPSKEINSKRDETIVRSELYRSQGVLKHTVDCYNTPLHEDGRPNLVLCNNLITEVEMVAKDYDVLITHWREDTHQEHRLCYELGLSMSRKSFKEFWCMDQAPYNLRYENFNANLYVDITDHVQQKIRALECYKSYFTQGAIDQIINYNRHRGSFLGDGRMAETFSVQYQKIT